MRVKKFLQWVMLLSGGISVCNLFVLYFFPSVYSFSLISSIVNFSVFKLNFIAISENKYGYIVISCILIILILIGAVMVKQNRILLPVFSFAVYLGDLIHAGCLFISDLQNGFINTVVILPGIIDIMAVVLFVLYFTDRIRSNKLC